MGFGEEGEGCLCQETGEQMLNFDGKGGTKTVLGNGEQNKVSICWEQGNEPIYFRGT